MNRSTEEKGAVVALMRRMGVKGHPFDPLPPDQHRWQRRRGQPELHRLWSWMVGHTTAFQHRCEYAVSDSGEELHIEVAAKDLGIDLPNAYRAWRLGVETGIFRNGTRKEGERKMYLCGSVKPEPAPDSLEEDEENCLYRLFPAHIRKQIKDWPRSQVETLWNEIATKDSLEREAMAVYVAAIRAHFIQEKDTVYQAHGVKLNPQAHVKNGEAPQEAEARRARVEPLIPGIALFVQTIEESVQSDGTAVYSDSVHSDSAGATLLRQNTPEKPRVRAAAGISVGNGGPLKPHAQDGGKPRKYLHAENGAPAATGEPENDEEREGLAFLFSEIANMQKAYKHADFSRELVSAERKSDRVTLLKILRKVGASNALRFCLHVAMKFKGFDRNGLGKAPARSPDDPHGPRSLGLIMTWAEAWAQEQRKAAGV